MVRLPNLQWAWTCNSHWSGVGKSFNLLIPALTERSNLVIQGCRFNPMFNQIEVWGYIEPENNITPKYKDDLSNSQRSSCYGGQSCDRGADGTHESSKSKESLR